MLSHKGRNSLIELPEKGRIFKMKIKVLFNMLIISWAWVIIELFYSYLSASRFVVQKDFK